MKRNPIRTIGAVLTSGVGVVLVLAGILKLIGVGAEDMVEGLKKANLVQYQTLISLTAIVCGLLLLVPPTWRFGFLMATAYWGAAIVAHLTYDDWSGTLMPIGFLSVMWIGGWLRGIHGVPERRFE